MIYHMADKVNGATGDVSALCYDTPKSIDLKKESWVLRPRAVTCVACKAALRARRKVRVVRPADSSTPVSDRRSDV